VPDVPKNSPPWLESPHIEVPQAEPLAKTRPEVPHLFEYAALRASAVYEASCQPAGTDIGVCWQFEAASARGQLSMVAYRQPVLLDVNVFDKDAAVGAAVVCGLGANVGAKVVTGVPGTKVGTPAGVKVGANDGGSVVGPAVGLRVGAAVGAGVVAAQAPDTADSNGVDQCIEGRHVALPPLCCIVLLEYRRS
jgi:hypothetical protein